MAPHVNVDTQEITERTRRELLRLLESVRGKKNLVVQKSLLGPIGLFTKFSTLQEYGVEKLFVLENRNVETAQKNIVFLARGEKPKEVQTVADSIKQIRKDSQTDHDFSIIWVPRRTLLSDRILEENGVLGEAAIMSCPLHFLALDPDLLSLELEDATSDIYMMNDPTSIYLSAQALMTVQKQCGLIPRILGKGDNAKRLADLLLRLRAEEDVTASTSPSGGFLSTCGSVPSATIDSLVIIDREVDYATPLLTQLTYAGLLDETFRIQYNTLEASTSIVGPGPSSNPSQTADTTPLKRKIPLDSTEPLFPSLKDLNFALLGPNLNTRARNLAANYESRHRTDASISDLKSFVSKLPSYQAEQASLKIHTGLAEEVMKSTRAPLFSSILEIQQTFIASGDAATTALHEKIESLIAQSAPLPTVLRLLSLSSSLTGGLRPRDLDNFKRLVCHGYGFQHLLTFSSLEKHGLLTPRVQSNTGYLNPMAGSRGSDRAVTDYNSARKGLKLLVDDVDEEAQVDPSYAYSGYAPLSVRLVQCALQKGWAVAAEGGAKGATGTVGEEAGGQGWKGFEDVVGRVKGATVDVVQRGTEEGAGKSRGVLKGSGMGGTVPNTPVVGSGTGVGRAGGKQERTVTSIVFFLGGVTYAEVAALRLVGRKIREHKGGENRRLVIATTGVITGDRLVGGAIEEANFG
ncbi:Sec1-like protein 2 [Elsinoe australis]|uniref:Sec1-like protein 2 n=1 Tax=Elsinoe australis TaxID=40998 RepID=A0A4V6DU63_9PEZI|nr:Sec1-like protein 2 [Elsinoe australis]